MRAITLLIVCTLAGAACAESQEGRSGVTVPENARYVASDRGSFYYAISCEAWRDLSPGNRVWFGSAAEAREAGYEPSAAPGCAPRTAVEDGGTCVVRSVADGDTLTCDDGTRVRLLLIDSPEIDQGGPGELARRQLRALAPPGSSLRVELDVQVRDRYGRVLAYLYTDEGVFLNEAMARGGYAVQLTYPPNVKYAEQIGAAVGEARRAGAGLWETEVFACPPVDYRAGRCDPG